MQGRFSLIALLVISFGMPTASRAQDEPPSQAAEDSDSQPASLPGSEAAQEAIDAVRNGDLRNVGASLMDLLEELALPALMALAILIAVYFAAAFVARIASVPVRSRVDETLGRFVGKLVFYSIMVGALLGVLQFFGVGVTSFAAVIASAGFAIGLAFQGTLSNFAAGVMLLVFRPFKVGDVISAAGITAKVSEIDLFNTVFDTPDNRRIFVPNGSISGGIIENITHHHERRLDLSVGVDYTADIDRTREVLGAALSSVDGVIEGEGRGVQISLSELAESSVKWNIRMWCQASDYWPKREELIRAIKIHLDDAGIGIPYPQMDVHLSKSTDA